MNTLLQGEILLRDHISSQLCEVKSRLTGGRPNMSRRTITRNDITPSTLELVRKHAAKLNRQIGKLRSKLDSTLDLVTVTVVREFTVPYRRNGVAMEVPRLDIVIDAPDLESIIAPGYSLVAIIKSATDGEDTQKALHRIITRFDKDDNGEGIYDLDSYRTDALACAECGKVRRRHTVILLYDSTNDELVTLGTDCADKYLPRASNSVNILEAITHFPALEADSDCDIDDFGPGGSYKPTFDRDDILVMSTVWTAKHGYARVSDIDSTKDTILAILLGSSDTARELQREYSKLYDQYKSESKWDVLQGFVRGLVHWATNNHGSDYADNLAATLAGGPVSLRTLGLVVSAPSVYRSHLGQAKLKAETESHLPPETLPPTGPTMISGEVISSKIVETDFGPQQKMLVEVVDVTANTRYRLYGSVAAAIRRSINGDSTVALVGARVEFKASITPKEPGFGFYSRPSKARLTSSPEGCPVAPFAALETNPRSTTR